MEKTKELIELLIANGANVNALANATYAYKQRTPLDIAQKKNKKETMPQLTETQNRILRLSSGEVRRAT